MKGSATGVLAVVAAVIAAVVSARVGASARTDAGHAEKSAADRRGNVERHTGSCSSIRHAAATASGPESMGRGRAMVHQSMCAPVVGRSPADWARTTMVGGRPLQPLWSMLREQRLPNVLGPIPDNWNEVRPTFAFVGTRCTTECTFTLQVLVAVAALDALIDARFAAQRLAMPIDLDGHASGECITIDDLLTAIDDDVPFTEEGRAAALVEALATALIPSPRQLRCT